MSATPQSPGAEALLAHAEWVRALARTLVADPERADDVVQAAWLDALQRPPRDARNLRAWLSQVVRNAARQARRSGARRDARERAAARPEALPSTAELVAEAELQRELVGHVLALKEPYRTTVLLRFVQGLDAREIARRQAVPLATVRTRLQRALARLRERLDREHGERANWCAALLPLADGVLAPGAAPGNLAWVSIGGSAMASAWKLGLTALVVAVGGWWAWRGMDGIDGEPARAAVGPDAVAATPPPAVSEPTVATEDRARVPAAPSASPDEAPGASAQVATAALRRVAGRVVDALGRPVAGLRLVADVGARESSATRQHATTGDDGWFAFEVEGLDVHVGSADDAWVLTCSGGPLSRTEQIWVAMPAFGLAGLVVDESEVPVQGARVVAEFHCAALEEFPYVLYGAERQSWTTTSEADGTFRFESVPSGSELSVVLDGYETAHVREPGAHTRVVLRAQSAPRTRAVRGVVLDAAGAPVPGARIDFGAQQATSDAQGRFELAAAGQADATPLSAVKTGHAPAVLERFGRTLDEHPDGVDGVVLRLGDASLSIAGRVLDANGRPGAGWWIDLADGTPWGASESSLELAAARAEGGASALETDGDGRFRISGLRERTYIVRAHDPTRCLFLVSEPTAAGSEELVLREPGESVRPRLRGRVLSRRGRPVGGAVVRVTFTSQVLHSGEALVLPCRESQADADGWFEFTDLARLGVLLRVDGPHVEGSDAVAIPVAGDVELRASVRCRFRADVRAGDPADRLRVLDGDGRELPITVQSADGGAALPSVERRGGGFPVCVVGEDAATLVLLQGEVELRRIPIELQPSTLQIVVVP